MSGRSTRHLIVAVGTQLVSIAVCLGAIFAPLSSTAAGITKVGSTVKRAIDDSDHTLLPRHGVGDGHIWSSDVSREARRDSQPSSCRALRRADSDHIVGGCGVRA
jgi:hypothetical protein